MKRFVLLFFLLAQSILSIGQYRNEFVNSYFFEEIKSILIEAKEKGFKEVKAREQSDYSCDKLDFIFINDTLIKLKRLHFEIFSGKKPQSVNDIDYNLWYYSAKKQNRYKEIDSSGFHILKRYNQNETAEKKDSSGRVVELINWNLYNPDNDYSITYRDYKGDTMISTTYFVKNEEFKLSYSTKIISKSFVKRNSLITHKVIDETAAEYSEHRNFFKKVIMNKSGLIVKIKTIINTETEGIDGYKPEKDSYSIKIHYIK